MGCSKAKSYIFGSSARRKSDRYISDSCKGLALALKEYVVSEIIRDACHNTWVSRERNGRQRTAISKKTANQLSYEM